MEDGLIMVVEVMTYKEFMKLNLKGSMRAKYTLYKGSEGVNSKVSCMRLVHTDTRGTKFYIKN